MWAKNYSIFSKPRYYQYISCPRILEKSLRSFSRKINFDVKMLYIFRHLCFQIDIFLDWERFSVWIWSKTMFTNIFSSKKYVSCIVVTLKCVNSLSLDRLKSLVFQSHQLTLTTQQRMLEKRFGQSYFLFRNFNIFHAFFHYAKNQKLLYDIT